MRGTSTVIAGMLARDGALVRGWVEIRGPRVAEVGDGRAPRGAKRYEGVIAPGLCDIQVNGAGGVNVTDGARALDVIDAVQLDHGVTSYLPTIITTAAEQAVSAVDEIAGRIDDPASPVEGIHLEGPFLNPEYRGVHRAEYLAVPRDGEPEYYRRAAVRLITLAPELPGALELIASLRARGVAVSIGHTGASARQAEAALARGASSITHLFNAMKALHHRSPNVPGWALVRDGVGLGVIADGFHVDPLVLRLVARLAAERVVLVTDASPGAAAADGEYEMAGVPIRVEAGTVRHGEGGHAGSALTLDEAVRRWIDFTGASVSAALAAASERPARLVGLATGLHAGAPADIVLWSVDGTVEGVIRRGSRVR